MSKGNLLFAQKIKSLRAEWNLSQQQMADMLGLRKTAISNYESGYSTPTYETLTKFMYKFNLPSEYFFPETSVGLPKLTQKMHGTSMSFYQSENIEGLTTHEDSLRDSVLTLPGHLHVPKGTYIATTAEDNSMNLCGIKKGTVIVINTEKKSPYSGQIFAAIHKGFLLIRKLIETDGVLYMTAQSTRIPTGSSKEKLPEEDFQIIGVVERLIIEI